MTKYIYFHCEKCDMRVRHILQDGKYVCQNCGHKSEPEKGEHNPHSIIDGMIEELENVVEEGRSDIEAYRYLKKLCEADKISKEQAEKAMEVTCYGHFAGCCGPEKACPIHLSVCEALGVNPNELFQVKKDAVDAWLKEKLTLKEET